MLYNEILTAKKFGGQGRDGKNGVDGRAGADGAENYAGSDSASGDPCVLTNSPGPLIFDLGNPGENPLQITLPDAAGTYLIGFYLETSGTAADEHEFYVVGTEAGDVPQSHAKINLATASTDFHQVQKQFIGAFAAQEIIVLYGVNNTASRGQVRAANAHFFAVYLAPVLT